MRTMTVATNTERIYITRYREVYISFKMLATVIPARIIKEKIVLF